LITLRGLRILRSADVVLHDALVTPDLLREVRKDAQVLNVGKRGYCVGSTHQEEIHRTMIGLARAGHSVCRLKGGDPYIFGRGGEEAEALYAAGIPFEIVPGVTAANAACAAARIPLTHRCVGSAIVFASGHHDPEGTDCTLDWEALARVGNIVFYMASRHTAAIARRLIAHGLAPQTPVALISQAAMPDQSLLMATLGEMAAGLSVAQSPTLIVVGECVRHRCAVELPCEQPLEVVVV
jgi:uroporphyrin-III C-methyltransferase